MSAGPRRAALPVLGVVVALVVSGCGGPGGGAATTNDGACAAVLPLARSIVHDQGTPILIRRIDRADADTLSREVGAPPPPPPAPPPPPPPGSPRPRAGGVPKTCLIVYQGHYPPGSVVGATPPAVAGTYALMVLRVRKPGVDRVLVTPTLPADTRHRSWWRRLLALSS